MRVCCEQSLSSLFYFAGHTAPHVHNTGYPVSTDSYRPGVSRPVKSRSCRHSGRTDSTHCSCYECYQRSQFTEDNTEPSFLPGINSMCQFTVPPNHPQVVCANDTYVDEAHDSGQSRARGSSTCLEGGNMLDHHQVAPSFYGSFPDCSDCCLRSGIITVI